MIVFDRQKGAAAELVRNNPNSLVMILLQANEVDTTLETYTDVATLLAATGNTEATFTNYARKTTLVETINVDNTNHWVLLSIPQQTFTSAGGTTNNTLTKILIAVQTATAGDAGLIPLTAHDYSVTTDGQNDLVIDFSVNGFYKAS